MSKLSNPARKPSSTDSSEGNGLKNLERTLPVIQVTAPLPPVKPPRQEASPSPQSQSPPSQTGK